MTIVDWIDIFSRATYKHIIVDSLNYCIGNKGLTVYCWCLMSKYYKVWQDGNEAKEIHTDDFLDEKMEYIHRNPVRAEIVSNPADYLYSSARDYSGEKGLVPIEFV
jgi:hypothetical protein